MGVGASSAAGLENPFPIEPAIEKDLLRLSFVVSRLLNKPDLYDLNNLARPGACGDYAVFLKDKLEKRLMPFIADISGGAKSLAVVYQNPLKAFDKVETRKEVCQSLANTMVRLVSIVVACLASLQFESPRAREAAGIPAAVPAPIQQRGGANGDAEIITWLTENGYLGPPSTLEPLQTEGRHVLTLKDPVSYGYLGAGATPTLTLRLNRAPEQDGRAYAGYISSSLIPDNYLKAYIMKPVQLRPISVLPIHVVDNTGLTWLAGALYKGRFLSFGPKRQPESLVDTLNTIFRKALTEAISDPTLDVRLEPRDSLNQAEQVFRAVRTLQNLEILQRALAPYLSSATGAYYPGGSPGIGPQSMGFGGLGDLLPRRPYGGIGLPAGLSPYGRPGELAAAEYVVPPPVAKAILTTFRKHSGEIGAANNPAQIRATLLAGNVLRDRTIQTRICQDPYWISTTMASIYPWAALQFLCIEDYKTLATTTPLPGAPLAPVIPAPVVPTAAATGGAPTAAPARPLTGGTSKLKLSKEWADFVTELRKLYDGDKVPGISVLSAGRDGENPSLEELRFVEINKVPGCTAPGVSPRARFQEIQNGVLRLQGLYEEHSKEVWKILNSLIFVIEDPDSKAELVRLNPQIFASGVTTSAFIEKKAEEARTLLAEFYLEVEKVYTDTIRNMRILN